MQSSSRLFRLSALLAATSLATAPVLAQAQAPGTAVAPPAGGAPALAGAPSPGGAPSAAGTAQNGDPPAMVGRLSQISGTVSFHGPEDTQWSAATLNFPVSTGDAFWTEPQARATIEFAGNRIDMQSQTELDINQLDEQKLIATEPQGEVCMAMPNLPNGNSVTVQTPRGTVQIAASGHYAIVAGDTQAPTTISVVDGSAQVTGNGVSLQVGPHQMATITGDTQLQGNVGPAPQDPCLSAMMAPRPAPAAPAGQAAVAPPPDVQYMTGYEDLAQYGAWQQAPEYGSVWYPQVGPDWVPYREGRWAYVGRWGWTWVDNEPWGFAPFHYGRWANINNRWGWVPFGPGAPSGRPVYAPALVSFFGIGAAAVTGAAIGAALARGSVGWVPLGPRQAYYPWYHASPNYVRNINIRQVTNVNVVVNNYNARRFDNEPIGRFPNARAATMIPAAAMVGSRPVAQSLQRVDAAELNRAQHFIARDPVRPGAETVGLSAGAARRFGVQVSGRPMAPGPQLRAEGRAGMPGLRPANAPGAAGRPGAGPEQRPGGPGEPNAFRPGEPNVGRPGEPGRGGPGGLPALRTPGERPGQPGAAVNDQRPGGPGANGPRGPEMVPGGAGAGARGPAAGGPGAATRGPEAGGQPALRAPGARPGEPGQPPGAGPGARPGGPNNPGEQRPGDQRPGDQRPGDQRPGDQRPGDQRPGDQHPGDQHLGAGPNAGGPRPVETPRGGATPGEPPRANAPTPVPHAEAPRAEPGRQAAPQAAPQHQEAPQRQEAPRQAPHAEAPRPAVQPHQEAPRPAPRAEAPRAEPPHPAAAPHQEAPRQEAPRQAPHAEAPRPAPHQEAPRQEAPHAQGGGGGGGGGHPEAGHQGGGGGHPGGHEEHHP